MTAATDPPFELSRPAQAAAPARGLRRIAWTIAVLTLWEGVARFGPWPDWIFPPPSAVAVCGVSPTWPITGMPAWTIARARSAELPPRSSLTASQPASFTNRCALRTACSSDTS